MDAALVTKWSAILYSGIIKHSHASVHAMEEHCMMRYNWMGNRMLKADVAPRSQVFSLHAT